MEKQKVYVITVTNAWGLNDCEGGGSDSYVDSVWNSMDSSKSRLDNLVNEHIRRDWYVRSDGDPTEYELNASICDCQCDLNPFKMMVSLSDPTGYEATYYELEEFKVDPELPEFKGP